MPKDGRPKAVIGGRLSGEEAALYETIRDHVYAIQEAIVSSEAATQPARHEILYAFGELLAQLRTGLNVYRRGTTIPIRKGAARGNKPSRTGPKRRSSRE